MSRERDIFLEALARSSAEERAAFVRGACGDDEALGKRVQDLLNAHEGAGRFLKGQEAEAPGPDGVSAEPGLAEGPGTVIGRYKLLQKIGEGGFGVVYMAEQREPVKRKVALKIIKLGMDTRQVVARFEAERQALALMEHPNIAKIFDAGVTGCRDQRSEDRGQRSEGPAAVLTADLCPLTSGSGRPYFVMELVRGTPITQFCEENQSSMEERLRLFVQICGALQHAHQKGVIHRDIKPTNVLITMHDDKAVPKVIDFGIAKAIGQDLTDKTVFTRFHEFLGTPAYMSPEQTQLSGLDIDTRSDIYSLGVLLYELLTDRTPFDAKELLSASYDELRRRIREDEPLKPSTRLNTLAQEDRTKIAQRRRADPHQLRRALKGDLDWIVMKALEKDRSRRYESAGAFAQDIERYLSNEPVIAVGPSLVYRSRKFARRHRAALSMALVVLSMLVAGTIVSAWLAVRATLAEKTAKSLLEREQEARHQLEGTLAQLQEARQTEQTLRQRADQEADRARTEAATAAAVTRFLNEDVFAAADPEHEPDREITMRTVLERASQQLQSGLAAQPLVAAAIHSTIGRAYRNLSLYAQAEEHLRHAHQIYARELGERHPDTVRALIEFASALGGKDQWPQAQPLIEEARALARDQFGDRHPLTIKCATTLAWCHYRMLRRAEAFQLAEETFAAAQGTAGVDDADLMSVMYLVARRRGAKQGGQFEAGEQILLDALEVSRQRRGESHLRTLWAKSGLAAYYYDHGKKLEEAEALYREVLEIRRRALGENHAATLLMRDNLGLLYLVQKRPADALYQYLRLLQLRPDNKRALEYLPGLLGKAPLKALLTESSPEWRVTTLPPSAGWPEFGFDDSSWPQSREPKASEVWLRLPFELASVPTEPLVFRTQGWLEFELFVNGVKAVESGPASSKPQTAVGSAASAKAIRIGRNIIAVRGTRLDPQEPVRIDIYHFPTPSAETRN